MAERQGFEPWVPFGTSVFKTGAFDHSATSPGFFWEKMLHLREVELYFLARSQKLRNYTVVFCRYKDEIKVISIISLPLCSFI